MIHTRIPYALFPRVLAFFLFYQRMLLCLFLCIEAQHSVTVNLLDSKTSRSLYNNLLSHFCVLPEKLKEGKTIPLLLTVKDDRLDPTAFSLPIITLVLYSIVFTQSCKLIQLCVDASNQLLKCRQQQ